MWRRSILGAVNRPFVGSVGATRLIVDADNGDRDDAKAFAYLNYALDNGYDLDLIGVGADERSAGNAGQIQSYFEHFGRTTRIGKNKTGLAPTDGFENSYLFPRRVLRVGDAEEVVAMYRQLLSESPDNSVVICGIGRLNNIADLLASSADGFSALNGIDLVAAKCSAWYCMGGYYPTVGVAESNFLNAPADANYAVANWPASVPAYFIGYEVGQTFFSATSLFTALANDSPIKAKVTGAGFNGEWDVTAMMAAIEPDNSAWYTWTRGTNSVNSSTGVNTFTDSPSGPHYYAVKAVSDATFEAFLVGKVNYYKANPYSATPIDVFAFNEGSGSTTTSQNGIVATLSGTASLSSVPGSLSCARTGFGYARAPTNDIFRFFPRMSRTMYCEFTTKTLSGTEEVVFGGDRDAGGWWRFGWSAANAWLITFNGGADITGGTVASSTTYKTAIVFDGVAGTAKLFVNGAQVGSTYTTTSEVILATLGNWDFGGGAGTLDATRVANININTWDVRPGAASDAQAQTLTT